MEKTGNDTIERLEAVIRAVSPRSHAQFARMTGLQPASLSRLLKGEYRMSLYYADKIVGGVEGLNRDYLLGKSDYMGTIADAPDYPGMVSELQKRVAELEDEVGMLKWLIKRTMIEEGGE